MAAKHPSGKDLLRSIDKGREAANRALKSSKGKDMLLYLFFVLIAFIFWVLLSLDSEVTKDYEVPVRIAEVPDSVHIIGAPPATLTVSVRSKGAQLIRYEWGKMPTLNLRYRDYAAKGNRFTVTRSKLAGAVRDFFGAGVTVNSIRPDSIAISYTVGKGVRLPIHVIADVHTDLQYTISGPVTTGVDSVTLYSIAPLPKTLTEVYTDPVVLSDLKDTTRVEVPLQPLDDVKMVPSVVMVTIPVEPLISKKRPVDINVLGLPDGISMITFPAKATVSYLVPMSSYNLDIPIKIFVDYASINRATGKAPLQVGVVPPPYINLTFTPDSVEYVIERK